jgi:hypothetical protein
MSHICPLLPVGSMKRLTEGDSIYSLRLRTHIYSNTGWINEEVDRGRLHARRRDGLYYLRREFSKVSMRMRDLYVLTLLIYRGLLRKCASTEVARQGS